MTRLLFLSSSTSAEILGVSKEGRDYVKTELTALISEYGVLFQFEATPCPFAKTGAFLYNNRLLNSSSLK